MDNVFSNKDYSVQRLVDEVRTGDLGLPDIQRPFVWKTSKVRDLFDSMYRGFPVGYLLFWENEADPRTNARAIGVGEKQSAPRKLIVDGQQRLTSLYAVISGTPVLDADYRERQIRIAFHPGRGEFDVANAARERSPEWIHDIANVWRGDFEELLEDYTEAARGRGVSQEELRDHKRNLRRLQAIENYVFTAIELSPRVPEEEVAEVFVRINSQGAALKESDFILTVMSVYRDDLRQQVEGFLRNTRTPGHPLANVYLDPDAEHIVRVATGLAFRRGRLRYAYQMLRGKDLATGEFGVEHRQRQFAQYGAAQQHVIDATSWREYQKAMLGAGYVGGKWITAKAAIYYGYLMYLIGQRRHGLSHGELRPLIAKWFFMSTITGHYSGSPESVIERELLALPDQSDPDGFVAQLDHMASVVLTDDYFTTRLPDDLAKVTASSPSLYGYYAALNVLDAPVLFSRLKVRDLLRGASRGGRADLEAHHLFPKQHLAGEGISDRRQTDQIANFALVEWPDNAAIGGRAPSDYIPEVLMRLSEQGLSGAEIERMVELHALPDRWEELPYDDFLSRRRILMASVVAKAWDVLRGLDAPVTQTDAVRVV